MRLSDSTTELDQPAVVWREGCNANDQVVTDSLSEAQAICSLPAKIYLNPVDQVFKRERIGNISKDSIHLVGYADDKMIHAQKNLKKGIDLLGHYTQR